MLKVINVDKTINNHRILKDINFEVTPGERIVIIGPSGCGKTTLLRCLNGLTQPSKGQVLFKNADINDPHTDIFKIREKIGVVFQHYNLFPHLTVLQNITLAPIKLKKMSEATAKKKALALLTRFGIKDKADAYPGNLSGGQIQRVAIARTLIMEPVIILADEPTSALDPEMVGDVISIFKKIGKTGKTMIIVTHEMEFIEDFATRIFFMEDGKIIQDAKSYQELYKSKEKRIREFITQTKQY